METKVIGYSHSEYGTKRNVFGNDVNGFVFKKQKYDLFKVLDHIYFTLKKDTNFTFHNYSFGYYKCDLMHFFNGISLNNKPWITTFEATLPRVSHFYSLGIKKLSSPYCKQLIAFSQCAYNQQSDKMLNDAPEHHDSIMNKTLVLHPPQKTIIHSVDEKKYGSKLSFVIIGADFFRKGGMEILEAFDHLLDKNYDLELNIVSSLQYGDYASRTTKQDLDKALRLINKHPDNIHYFTRLPNNEVMELLKKSHIGLLPTYSDTYGYSAIEAQACGCVVISTDVWALPEINNDEIGYMIPVPKDHLGKGMWYTKSDRAQFTAAIKEGLINTIEQIYSNTAELKVKSKLSLERIKSDHDPLTFSKSLETIYLRALS